MTGWGTDNSSFPKARLTCKGHPALTGKEGTDNMVLWSNEVMLNLRDLFPQLKIKKKKNNHVLSQGVMCYSDRKTSNLLKHSTQLQFLEVSSEKREGISEQKNLRDPGSNTSCVHVGQSFKFPES